MKITISNTKSIENPSGSSMVSDWYNLYMKNMMTKSIKVVLCSFLFIVFGASDANATHVIGGELKYRHIIDDQYEIILTFRRDCLNGAPNALFEDRANIWVFNGKGNLKLNIGSQGKFVMDLNPTDTLNQIIMSDCGFEGTQVCVEETIYKGILRLPFNPGEEGYLLAYQRCCRNSTLENILDPLETGGTWTTAITEEVQSMNNINDSPNFVDWAPVYVCANEDVNFDHSAIDADGDSLVYRLCTPFTGATKDNPIATSAPKPPYTPVEWKSPFNLTNLLGGLPLQIDSKTGLMTGSPNLVGQFLVGICVEEYRNGVKIGEVRRDFQYNVRVCSPPPTALFEGNEGNCDGPDVTFDNQSLGATEFQWNFNFPNMDSAFVSSEENPNFVYETPGVYNVQLIVTRGADACSDTIVKQIAAIFTDIEVKYDLEIQACNEDGGYTIRLIDESIEPEEGFEIIATEWMITQNGSTQTFSSNIVNLNIDAEDFIVQLQVESETGCKKTLIDTVSISDFEHIADFVFELASCPELGTATIAFGDVSDTLNVFDSPVGYNWTVLDGTLETTYTDSSFTYDVIDENVIVVTLIVDFGGGCNATVTKEITIQDIVPQASYILQPVSCPDEGTVDLSFISTSEAGNPDYPIANTNWTITVAGQTLTGTTDTFNVNVPKDSLLNLELLVNFENGCGDVISESFIPGPFATIEFDAESMLICVGDTVPFVSDPNSDFTYTWSPETGLVFDAPYSNSNPGLIGIADAEYTATVTDGLCTVESAFMVTVLDGENLGISGDSITCDGNVELVVTGGIGEGEFEWSLTSDFMDIIFVGDTLRTNFDGQSQTYYVQFTGESCQDPFAQHTVILSDIFDVVFNGNPVRVCLSDTVPLLANPNPLLTYEWSPLTGIHFTDPTDGSTAQVIGIEDFTYNVTISDDFCSLDTFINVIIADTQEFDIVGDSIVCDENVQLIASGATGIGTYQWSLDEDFTTIIHEGDTLNTILSGTSDTYYVQFTDKTCGDLILTYDVRLFEFDLLFAEPYNICPGDTLPYTVFNQGEGPLTWVWAEDTHIISGGGTNMPTIGVGMDETEPFDLMFSATGPSGCMLSDTVSFIIMDNPVVDFNFELTECGELTVCFTIDSSYIGFPSWDFGDPSVTDDISIDAAPCYTYAATGIYDVTLANLTAICPFETVIKTITINDEINLDPIEDKVVCLGENVNFAASSQDNNISFVWCDINGDTLQIGADIELPVNEEFDLIIKGEDPNGCFSMDTVNVMPFEFDIVDNVPEVFCSDEETNIEITVKGGQDGFTFEWGPIDCVLSGGDTGNPVLIAADDKTYSVTITNTEFGCDTVKTYTISTMSYSIELDAEDQDGLNTDIINQGDEVTIFVIDAEDGYTYEWNDGSTDDELIVSPEETTTYSVTVTDDMGCTATDEITITVRLPECDETDIFLPSAFTPNGDGINDILYLRSNFIETMELVIFDRWGEEVFSSKDQTLGWDGTYKGKKLAPDVYAYTLRVTCINQIDYATRRNVSLLK
ncbi:MAG: gliding motility-associated-like protein [Saprospiraceae bacterium]|jgi:gliding motility-associated-like protein